MDKDDGCMKVQRIFNTCGMGSPHLKCSNYLGYLSGSSELLAMATDGQKCRCFDMQSFHE